MHHKTEKHASNFAIKKKRKKEEKDNRRQLLFATKKERHEIQSFCVQKSFKVVGNIWSNNTSKTRDFFLSSWQSGNKPIPPNCFAIRRFFFPFPNKILRYIWLYVRMLKSFQAIVLEKKKKKRERKKKSFKSMLVISILISPTLEKYVFHNFSFFFSSPPPSPPPRLKLTFTDFVSYFTRTIPCNTWNCYIINPCTIFLSTNQNKDSINKITI